MVSIHSWRQVLRGASAPQAYFLTFLVLRVASLEVGSMLNFNGSGLLQWNWFVYILSSYTANLNSFDD